MIHGDEYDLDCHDRALAKRLEDYYKDMEEQEEYWDAHAEDDMDEHQKDAIDLVSARSFLPVDVVSELDLEEIQELKPAKIPKYIHSNRQVDRYWFIFRKKILHRDHNRCVDCGDTENLAVHHLLEVQEDSQAEYLEDNCITVCPKCHKLRHYGK